MYRQLGKKVLKTVIQNENNVLKLENKIEKLSSNQDEYKMIIQEVVNHRRNGLGSKQIMSRLKNGVCLNNTEEYDEFRRKVKEHDEFLVKPVEVDEGVLECGKCGSKRTISYSKQTRSGDESTTVFALCYDCNNRWKM